MAFASFAQLLSLFVKMAFYQLHSRELPNLELVNILKGEMAPIYLKGYLQLQKNTDFLIKLFILE